MAKDYHQLRRAVSFASFGKLRHKSIRTTVRYTHVGYEQTRQTAEALSQILE